VKKRKRPEPMMKSSDFVTDLAGFAIKYRRVFFVSATVIYEWLKPGS
jgi:hypothetical protein